MAGSQENLLIFTASPDNGATSSIVSDIIFVLLFFSVESTICGYIFTEHLFFYEELSYDFV